ncbi:prepilin peptidase [Leifsonia shinshuensis]|uniref:Prepilin leader peptidase/N-methyltransferase n=1 Tax=Leifsonia shinshuensis TaxID=150026 RepID=A0A7G6YEZ0_9MICO|nr:A24 family peptidase [Leifsonia shinshuensis]QNE37055.1 prepilin peptidase [Leifsonia shinshuensis]
MTVIAVLAGVFGSMIGSFLNVVVFRVPAGRSIVAPPSACPSCGARIRAVDNIPVISWLVLRGRCRDCGAAISVRYPAVELGTALGFAAVTLWRLPSLLDAAASGSGTRIAAAAVELVAYLYLMAVSVALALIDLDTHRLPDKIVLPAYAVGGGLLLLVGVLEGDGWALLRALIGGVSAFVLYLLLGLTKPGAMGFGDIKLAGLLGLYLGWVGWSALAVGVFGGFVIGGIVAVALLAARRVTRRDGLPFGPSMLAGAWLGLVAGPAIWDAYLRLVGLA